MDIEIKVTKSNGKSQSAAGSFQRFSDAYLLMDTVVDIRETSFDGEYVIYIQPLSDTALRTVEISFDFDPSGAYICSYGASASDNISVLPADVPVPFSRDVFLAANYDYSAEGKAFVLNLGFTSFERFFTFFRYTPGRVTAVYNMENRVIEGGTILRLENIMIDDTFCSGLFLENVSASIARKQKIKKERPPVFACFTENCEDIDRCPSETVKKIVNGKEMFKAVIIDGRWQSGGEFSCSEEADPELFPEGIAKAAGNIAGNGFGTGLSFAPALISGDSPKFKDYNYRLYSDRNYIPSFGDVYPMNPASQDVQTDTYGFVKNAVSQWNSGALKLDHLGALVRREANLFSPVLYARDYSVGLFRRLLKGIRNAAGDDAFLIGSDLPGECAGIADGIVICGGISTRFEGSGEPAGGDNVETDGGAEADAASSSAWISARASIQNMLYRSFYNYALYRSFGAVLNCDEAGSFAGSCALSDDEFISLALTAAFSGGAVLTAGDIDALNPFREKLISNILPAGGITVRPADYLEYPYCTHAFCVVPDKSVPTEIHILYNFDDYGETRVLKAAEPSVFVDMLSGKLISSGRATVSVDLRPHSAVPVLVKKMPDHPALLWTGDNIYRGCVNTSDLFFSDTLIITSEAREGTEFNIYIPYGRKGDVYVNEKRLRLDALRITDLGEGSVFTYVLGK